MILLILLFFLVSSTLDSLLFAVFVLVLDGFSWFIRPNARVGLLLLTFSSCLTIRETVIPGRVKTISEARMMPAPRQGWIPVLHPTSYMSLVATQHSVVVLSLLDSHIVVTSDKISLFLIGFYTYFTF
jgi:hypothetical protein